MSMYFTEDDERMSEEHIAPAPPDVTYWDEGDEGVFLPFEDRPPWTVKRVIYLMIALVLIALLVVYTILPAVQWWLYPPPSQPLLPPLNL